MRYLRDTGSGIGVADLEMKLLGPKPEVCEAEYLSGHNSSVPLRVRFSGRESINRAANLAIKIIRRIEEVSLQDWAKVFLETPETYYLSKSIDESNFGGFHFYYVLVYKGSEIVGIAPCFWLDYALDTTMSKALVKLSQGLRKAFPGFLRMRVLMCGLPLDKGIIGMAKDDRPSVLKAIINGMEQIAKNNKASVIAFKDFSAPYLRDLDYALKEGFTKTSGFPGMEIDISFKSFEEYMMGLSYATRKDLRRKFKKAAGLKRIDLEVTHDVSGYLDQVYGLFMQTIQKGSVHFESVPKAFFRNLSKNMPGATKYFLWFIEGKLVAFDLCLKSGDTLIDEYIGLDYSLAYDYHLYFITFRDIINWCIENGIKSYYTGALDYDPKKRLGTRMVPLYIYARHMNKFMNHFLMKLFSKLEPDNYDRSLKSANTKSYS